MVSDNFNEKKEFNKKEYNKKWYEKNKEKHLKYCLEKTKCKCGSNITRAGMKKHERTTKHINFMETINNIQKS